jgi:CubicO group peptidase (beta-lactamase class C family)
MKPQPVRVTILISLVIVFLVGCAGSETTPTPAGTPTPDWQASTPEQQGMDSQKLVKMFDYIADRGLDLHSLLIVRNGVLVTEAYFFPYRAETLHSLNSSTKSVVSALIGIAVDKGFIRGVDQPLSSFFPDRTIANMDSRKQAITLEDLLTMSSGLDWPEWDTSYSDPANITRQMLLSLDPVQFVLDRPMHTDPGTLFNYNTGGSNLLSAILEQATGENTLEFAYANLFEPLGFSNPFWAEARNGMYRGGEGLMLTPRDMARFGILFLDHGLWDGRQVIPAAWVNASTRNQISTGPQAYAGDQYGYQWWLGWIQSPGFYAASGYGGQFIFVVPEKNLVAVFTGELSMPEYEDLVPKTLVDTYILPAVQSDSPLPANPEAAGQLAARIRAVSQPHPQPVSKLPALAEQVSGRTYVFDPNELGVQSFSLVFTEGAGEAHLFWKVNDRTLDLLVGLDDISRLTKLDSQDTAALATPEIFGFNVPENPAFSTSIKGSWVSQITFQMRFQFLGYSFGNDMDFAFSQGGVDVRATTLVDHHVVPLHGQPQNP